MTQETCNLNFGFEDFTTRNEGVLSLDMEYFDTVDYNQQLINSDLYTSQYTLDDISKQLSGTDFNDLEKKLSSSTYNISSIFDTTTVSTNDPTPSPARKSPEAINTNTQLPSTNDLYFGTDLYQNASNSPSISSISSTKDFSAPSSGSASTDILGVYQNDFMSQPESDNSIVTPQSAIQLDASFPFDQLLTDSPSYYQQGDNPSPTNAASCVYSTSLHTPDQSPACSLSISSTPSSQNEGVSSSRRGSLDSRLSLQKLGEILQTSSIEETMKVEKFVLNIFVKDLGFPLGYKTWIRDTNEKYRTYLLQELYAKVRPTYPELNKNLLETIVKRATYSMMQGRLRKERRAASKLNVKKKCVSK